MVATCMNDSNHIRVECEPLNDMDRVEERWRSLEIIANASPFLGWLWLSSWLRQRSHWPNAYEVTAWHDSKLVGIALLFKQTSRRAKFIPIKSLYINEAGESCLDMIIEHNGFLIDPRFERLATRAMCDFVECYWDSVDEVFISGVSSTNSTFEKFRQGSLQWKTERQSEGRYVDLTSLRSQGTSYLATLSKNRRYQIRRSIRAFEQLGSIQLECAENSTTALEWLGELKMLHQIHWESKGRQGAFSWIERDIFYKRLVDGGVPSGEVSLIRVRAGEATLGVLLCLNKNGVVYYLQSGFNYSLVPNRQPGYVTLSMSIQWYADHGADRYDFLAGGDAYKAILADQCYELVWGAAQRKRFKFKIIESLRGAKQSLASLRL